MPPRALAPAGQYSRRQFLATAGLVAAAGQVPSLAAAFQQNAGGSPEPLKPGRYPLGLDNDRDGLFYLPKGYEPGKPLPLMVICHGAGSSSDTASGAFPLADELGFIVMATDAKDWTWDILIKGFGDDVAFLQRAFQSVSRRCSVDRSKLALTGFSDGASYALSLGIGNGDVFGTIMSFSPGVMQPAEVNGKPKIFMSHGTLDGVMPIDDTSRKFVPRLKALGYDVTYREYEGKHVLPPEIRREAYLWWFGR